MPEGAPRLRSRGPHGWTVVVDTLPGLLPAEQVAAALPEPSFWLDSARSGYGSGRFSALGFSSAGEVVDDPEPLLAERAVPLLDLPFDLQGGLVGFLAYEWGRPCLTGRPATPPSQWLFADRLVVLDHETGHTHLLAVHDDGGTDAAHEWLATAGLLAPAPGPHEPRPVSREELAGRLHRGVEQYRADVEAALEQLRAGNSYEVCLTDEARLPARADDLALYLSLRRANAAPYGLLLRMPDRAVLSSSPERFLRVDRDGIVSSKPIKGTAARHDDPTADAAAADALTRDAKTRAENLMIVDLVRNDLSRVADDIGVDPLMGLESYATVHQLVSTIHGRLRSSVLDAVRACFPAGSMTGAPKPRTMEIIAALEQRERGIYSGAVGWLGLGGCADLSVVIRTAVREGDELTIGAGGAVVLDSDPDAEVAEMLDKLWATARGLA